MLFDFGLFCIVSFGVIFYMSIVKNYQKFWDDLERRGFPYVLKKYTEEGLTKRLYGNLKRAIKKLIKKM